MRLSIVVALPSLLTLALAGCGGSSSDAGNAPPFAREGVAFSVAAVGIACGADGNYTADVRWAVPGSGRLKLEIRIGAIDGTVFARSNDRRGSERTGPWVREGQPIYLVERESDQAIASVKAPPCTAAPVN